MELHSQSENSSDARTTITREGKRKMKRKGDKNPMRMHKTKNQLVILKQIHTKYRGKMGSKAKAEAVAMTGLQWIKIYKWFFDKQAKRVCPPEWNCRGCRNFAGHIFKVVRKDGSEILDKPIPVFKVEKI